MFAASPKEQAVYGQLRHSKTVILPDGDYDVFGDGTVVIKYAPGHTPRPPGFGSEIAQDRAGPDCGDLWHYPAERTAHTAPKDEWNPHQTLASRAAMEAYLKQSGATYGSNMIQLRSSRSRKLRTTLNEPMTFSLRWLLICCLSAVSLCVARVCPAACGSDRGSRRRGHDGTAIAASSTMAASRCKAMPSRPSTTSANIAGTYEAAKVIDARGALIMPGLINAHTHMSMSLFRGLADDLSLDDWLNKYIFPAEHRYVTRDFVTWATRAKFA